MWSETTCGETFEWCLQNLLHLAKMQPMQSPVFTIINKMLDGTLEQRLTDWRAEGLTFEAIARELLAEDITVTGATVRNWCIRLGIHEARVAS